MKRFHFRLNSVLLLRKRRLNEAEEQYSKAIAARRRIDAKIEDGQTQMEAMNAAVVSMWSDQAFVANQQESFLTGIKWAQTRIQEMENKRQQALAEEHRLRNAYIEANREYELLEKLRKTREEEHFYNEMQKEQAIIDDIFNARKTALRSVESS